jgi:type I restriction enzyme S subunit
MSEMKPGWRRVKFGEVVRLVSDRCDPVGAGIERFVGLEHIEPGDLRVRSWGDVADGTSFTNRFRPGQVLFGKRRAYQRKVAVADFEGVCSGDIYVLESAEPEHLLPELLPFICQTDTFFEHAVGTSAGSLSPRTNWTSLAGYEFALPPLEEQRKLAIALASFQALDSLLTEAITAANNLFEGLGRDLLVPAGVTFNQDSTLREVPSGWSARMVRELCRHDADLVIGPFGSNLVKSDYAGRAEGVPVIFVRDIRPNRFHYLSDCFISPAKAEELRAHNSIPGDLLITKVGVPATMGIPPGLAAVLPEGFPASIVTADVVRVRFDQNKILPAYASFLLNTAWGRQQTWRISPGSTTRFKMTLGNLSRVRLPIPPLEYQREAVAALLAQLQAVDALRARRASSIAARTHFLAREIS